jgi:hypothetical protein
MELDQLNQRCETPRTCEPGSSDCGTDAICIDRTCVKEGVPVCVNGR